MWFLKRKKKVEQAEEVKPIAQEQEQAFSTFDSLPSISGEVLHKREELINALTFQRVAPMPEGVAMDSCSTLTQPRISLNGYGVNPLLLSYYAASSSFIGYDAMSIIGQHWLVSKGCAMDVKDAVKKWYEISVGDGSELTAEQIKAIEKMDKAYKLKQSMIQGEKMKNVFGIRHILFKHTNPDFDYEKPFNPDSWQAGEYAGISQIDPYWITPEFESQDLTDPTRIDFYEPTFWIINGRRYHKSHFVILVGDEVPDKLKPTYRYGGISLVQKVYERIYAAERTANEAPQLAMTKRLVTRKTDLAKAQANKTGFIAGLNALSEYRNNYGVQVIGKDEELSQQDTSLADLDSTIMTQYQIVCAIFDKPASRMLGTGHGGFSTGETDDDYSIQNVEALQGDALERIAMAHYARLIPTFIKPKMGIEPEIEISWRPLKVMSETEQAAVREANARTDKILFDMGAIDGIDIIKRLATDKDSGYAGLEIPDVVDDIDTDPEITD